MLVGERERARGLLERDAELASVDEGLSRAAAGEGGLLVLEGPAGIGKTRVLDACRTMAADRGFTVLAARGGELERDHAYGVVRQLFEHVVASTPEPERAALLAGPAAHAGLALGITSADTERAADDQSFAVRHGLYWLTANLAGKRPLLVAVDDVHWADAPSLRFLAYLAPRLEGLPALVTVAARTGEPPTDQNLLGALSGDAAARRVEPRPLSEEATAKLLGSDTVTLDPEFAAACHAATGGNPFLVGELATALRHDGIAPVAANVSRVATLGPETVARTLVLRLGRVSAAGVDLARAVAVLGASADPFHAAMLAGLDEAQVREAIDALARAGVLGTESPLRFAHPILRTAVYQELPPAERDALHSRAAKLLARAHAPASEVATHLLATVPTGSAAVVAGLREAARVALGQGAADLAARYLRRALEEPPAPEDRAALLAELGRAEWLAGEDPLAALKHLRAALEQTTDPQLRTDNAIALARAAFSVGDIGGATSVLEEELALAGDRSADQRLTLEAEYGSVLLLNPSGPELGDRLSAFADLPGESIPELLVLSNLTAWEWMQGTAEETVRIAERALGGGRTIEAAGSDAIAVLEVTWALAFTERHDLAEATLQAALADARRTGSVFGLSATLALLSLVAYRRGDIVRAEAEARSGISLPGLPPFSHPPIHTFLALALVERDELDEADAVMERSWVGPHLPLLAQMNCAFYGRGMVRLRQGRLEEARDDFLELGRRDAQISIFNPGIPWRVGAARALAGLGEHDEAMALADEQIALAHHWGTPGVIGVALHARAVVGPAVELDGLQEAADVLAASAARLDHAYTVVDLGAALRAAGRRTEARDLLREGLDRARACGATALVRRAHEELVQAGAKPRRLQFSGVEALTASERRICDLAAGGATNREIAQELFITAKTVENHLGRAYNKLGISSRDQLGDALGGSEQKLRDLPS